MMDWENLRHFVALGQTGSLSAAARLLKVDHATVSRRLQALGRVHITSGVRKSKPLR